MGTTGERRIRLLGAVLVLLGALAAAGCSSDGSDGSPDGPTTTDAGTATTSTRPKLDDDLKLNEIQSIGTHNSFHQAAPPAERDLLAAIDPDQAASRQYSHPPLAEQLGDEQVRQIELDVFVDSQGGRFATPDFRTQAGIEPLALPGMDRPGTKVLHEQDVDYHSVCPTLVACLTEVKTWSDAHPDHVPVAINIQFKDGPLIFPVPDQAEVEPWTTEAMDGLDAEILSVFDRDEVLTPDDVRGDHATLEEAVLDTGWPTLGETRGKVLFLMINGAPYPQRYLVGHEGLEGRILFTNAEPGQPDASYVGLDDPIADGPRIAALVAKGYLVRTRADSLDDDLPADDTSRLEAALASGATWVSTDFPGPDGDGDGYTAALPGFVAARCNPVTAPADCTDAAIEPG